MEEDLETVIGEERLGDVPGIGKALTEKREAGNEKPEEQTEEDQAE